MKTLVMFLSLTVTATLFAQKGKVFESSWNKDESNELKVSAEKYSFYEKGKIYYIISNNNDNIFLDIKVEDSGVQNRILKEGFVVWINTEGKLAKKAGVRFPVGSQYSRGRNRSGMQEISVNADGSLVTPLSLANTIELTGFPNEESRRFPSENTDNFRGTVKYDNEGILHYKMTMPISKLPTRNNKVGEGVMLFNLGFEYGAPPVANGPQGQGGQQMPARAPSGGGGRGGARGGGMGGSIPGSGMPGGGGRSMNSPELKPPVILWIKNIKLATDK